MSSGFIAGHDFPLQSVTFDPRFGATAPRAVVAIDGTRYVPTEIEVNNNAHGATGDANIVLPIAGNQDFTQQIARGTIPLGGGFTTEDNSPVYVQIYVGFPSAVSQGSTDISQEHRVFYGIVDQYSAAFADNTVTFACRSLAAPLADQHITRISMNETSIQFASAAASLFGLKFVTNVTDPITIQEMLAAEFVGGSNFSAEIFKRRYWDVLLQCAQFDNADVWVDQDTLYYAIPDLLQRTTVECQYGRDVLLEGGLVGTHSPQFNKNIEVQVHSYQRKYRRASSMRIKTLADGSRQYTQTTRTVTSQPVFGSSNTVTTTIAKDGTVTVANSESSGGAFNASTGPASESGKEIYPFFPRNIAPNRVNSYAQALWRQISEHEYSIDLAMPVRPDNLATLSTVSSLVHLTGCPYKNFNGTYYPRKTTLRVHNEEGAIWRFQAVNHPPPQGAI